MRAVRRLRSLSFVAAALVLLGVGLMSLEAPPGSGTAVAAMLLLSAGAAVSAYLTIALIRDPESQARRTARRLRDSLLKYRWEDRQHREW